MSREAGAEPIADDEALLRRVPVNPAYFNADIDDHPSPLAFRPRPDDATGLSLFRAKYISPADLAKNDRGKTYYIACFRAGDLRSYGIEVSHAPLPDQPGHAELPGLRYDNRKTDQAEEWQVALATRLCLRMEGPFP